MKYITIDKINKNNMACGIEEINPIFESKEEWMNFNAFPTREMIEKEALKIYDSKSQEEKDYYGESELMSKCMRQVERDMDKKVKEERSNMLKNAEPLQGSCLFLSQERRVTMHDEENFNLGIFANREALNDCLEGIKSFGKTGYPFVVSDENGKVLEEIGEKESTFDKN